MPRNFLIQIKVSEVEKAQIKEDAARMRQNVSEYARSLLLHEKDHSITDRHSLPENPHVIPTRRTEAQEDESFKKNDKDFKLAVAPTRSSG